MSKDQDPVETWNAAVKIGAEVIWTMDHWAEVKTRTRSAAKWLSGHTPVIWLDDKPDCVLLSRVRVL